MGTKNFVWAEKAPAAETVTLEETPLEEAAAETTSPAVCEQAPGFDPKRVYPKRAKKEADRK